MSPSSSSSSSSKLQRGLLFFTRSGVSRQEKRRRKRALRPQQPCPRLPRELVTCEQRKRHTQRDRERENEILEFEVLFLFLQVQRKIKKQCKKKTLKRAEKKNERKNQNSRAPAPRLDLSPRVLAFLQKCPGVLRRQLFLERLEGDPDELPLAHAAVLHLAEEAHCGGA